MRQKKIFTQLFLEDIDTNFHPFLFRGFLTFENVPSVIVVLAIKAYASPALTGQFVHHGVGSFEGLE
jgi:hypothetical protein